MELFRFNAYALNGELDLNRLAARLGIVRKYRWEEPMKLNPATFSLASADDRELVYLYYFGGIVFINCSAELIARFVEMLPKHSETVKKPVELPFREEYRLEIDPARPSAIANDFTVMPDLNMAMIEIICFVIAKSVALERIEERIDQVFDEVEGLIANLDKGRLELPDQHMARMVSSILSFKVTSLAHIMVLDKPEITWDNPEADRLYTTMAGLFELKQRYQEIKHKSETLLDMTGVFTGISHARRSARLEWIIIILIGIEIALFLLEMLRK